MAGNNNPIINSLLWVLRISVGGLFIFSGLVKANDPSGLAYKMGEFFEAWALKDNVLPSLMHWFNEYALPFAIIMIVLEIVAGVALIIGFRFKFFSWLIFLLTAFFTFLTAYVLFSGNIKACGCFGDCIPLTPQETFTKDIVLLILMSIILLFRKHVQALLHPRLGNLVMIAVLFLSIIIQTNALKNLPYKDCLPYKVGNNIKEQMTAGDDYKAAVYESVLVYKNLQTGKKEKFAMDKIPWQDTLTWQYDTTLTTLISPAENEPKIKDFAISDYNGNNVTATILNYPGELYVLFIKDVKEANTNKIESIKQLISSCQSADKNVSIIAVSASNEMAVNEFKVQHNLNIDFYQIDGTVCKTAMRSNPGLIEMNNGTILGKWSYNNIPKEASSNDKNPHKHPKLFPKDTSNTIILDLPKAS